MTYTPPPKGEWIAHDDNSKLYRAGSPIHIEKSTDRPWRGFLCVKGRPPIPYSSLTDAKSDGDEAAREIAELGC